MLIKVVILTHVNDVTRQCVLIHVNIQGGHLLVCVHDHSKSNEHIFRKGQKEEITLFCHILFC